MPNIGPIEIIVLVLVLLLIFGPKRLPELGRSLGRGMREFKDSVSGSTKSRFEDDADDEPAQLARSTDDAHVESSQRERVTR